MTAAIPTHAPETFRKGTTVKWTLALSDYLPDDGWTLKYYFTQTSDSRAVTATNNGDGTFLVTITAVVAELFLAGDYTYFAEVTKTIDAVVHVYEVDHGSLVIFPSSRISGAVDGRSTVKQHLDAVEAQLAGKLSAGDAASYSIAGRSLSKYTYAELLELRYRLLADYRKELQAERIEKGLGTKGKVRTRFISSS